LREEPVFNGIELGTVRRIMNHKKPDTQFVGKVHKILLDDSVGAGVRASAVSQDNEGVGIRVLLLQVLPPDTCDVVAEGADEEKEDPVYHDMSVYRTADIDGTAKINALWQNLKAKQPKGTGINRQSPTYDYEMMRIGKILPKINKEFKAEDTAD